MALDLTTNTQHVPGVLWINHIFPHVDDLSAISQVDKFFHRCVGEYKQKLIGKVLPGDEDGSFLEYFKAKLSRPQLTNIVAEDGHVVYLVFIQFIRKNLMNAHKSLALLPQLNKRPFSLIVLQGAFRMACIGQRKSPSWQIRRIID